MAKKFTVTENHNAQLPESKIPGRLLINSNGNLYYDIDEETRLSLGGGGTKTNEGGEVFNDTATNMAIVRYTTASGAHNIAGTKVFKILEVNELDPVENIGTFTLDGTKATPTYEEVLSSCRYIGESDIFEVDGVPCIPGMDYTSAGIDDNNITEALDITIAYQYNKDDDSVYVDTPYIVHFEAHPIDTNTVPILTSSFADYDGNEVDYSEIIGKSFKFFEYNYDFELHEGDLYSLEIDNVGHLTDCGQIDSIDTNTNVVTVKGAHFDSTFEIPERALFNVIDKPLCGSGTHANCKGAFTTGYNNIASKLGAFATGYGNIAGSRYSFVSGQGNRAGVYSSVGGRGNSATGQSNLVNGKDNKVPGWNNLVVGTGNNVQNHGNLVGGSNNILHNKVGASIVAGQGNELGTENAEEHNNSMLVCGYGNKITEAYSAIIGLANTIEAQSSLIFGELNKITPNGRASTVVGYRNSSDGLANLISGRENTVSDATDKDKGANNASGYKNTLRGAYGLVSGYSNNVYGNSAVCLGNGNIIGKDSTRHDVAILLGSGLKSYSSGFVALGRYNSQGWTKEFDSPIFQVGMGTSDTERANAFSINKYGQAFLPNIPGNDIGASTKAIATKGYVDTTTADLVNSTIQIGTIDPNDSASNATSKIYIQY